VSSLREILSHLLRDTLMQGQLSQFDGSACGARPMGILVVPGRKPRRGHGVLRRHSEFEDMEETVQSGLILQVPHRHTDAEERLSVFRDNRWRQGDPGALSRLDAVWMAFHRVEATQSIAMSDAE
jgi:hypothetical protein